MSERTGVAPSALRFYEAEGLIHPTAPTGGQRRYARDALRRVSFIRVAQQVGLTLDEIRDRARLAPREPHPDRQGLGTLSTSWRPASTHQIAMLERLRDRLARLHRLRLPLARGSASCSTLTTKPPNAGPGPRYILDDD